MVCSKLFVSFCGLFKISLENMSWISRCGFAMKTQYFAHRIFSIPVRTPSPKNMRCTSPAQSSVARDLTKSRNHGQIDPEHEFALEILEQEAQFLPNTLWSDQVLFGLFWFVSAHQLDLPSFLAFRSLVGSVDFASVGSSQRACAQKQQYCQHCK